MQLIPNESRPGANYWCSWRSQRLFMADPFLHLRLTDFAAHDRRQRDALSDAFLFGDPGVAAHGMEEIRGDMILLLDDGWDLPYRGDYRAFGSLELNPERFPYGGKTPAENLKILNEKVLSLGYAGTGLWIPMTCLGESADAPFTEEEFRSFWAERARWLNEAGIVYVKADWGVHGGQPEFRALLTSVFHEYAPRVLVEHAAVDGWFSDPDADREKLSRIFSVSDVFRCYDAVPDFNSVTTLSRCALMLTLPQKTEHGCRRLLNAGEDPYLAAALGATTGVMSHPLLRGSAISIVPDSFDNGISARVTRKSEYHSFDHYVRALRWQRLAPAFPVGEEEVHISPETLTDSWTYEKEPYPYAHTPAWTGRTFCQTAPQAVARNAELPLITEAPAPVRYGANLPYLAASRNPETGAYTVAALPRTVDGVMNVTVPEAGVLCRGLSADAPFAVFGRFSSLTLVFDRNIEGRRLFGGDILLDDVPDLTGEPGATVRENRLTLDGGLLCRIGLRGAAFHDLAEPGSVFRLV